jgi:hypothetical protein
MEFKFIELNEKLKKIDAMISNEELEFMQKEYERLLGFEERKLKPIKKEIFRLYGMIDFLGTWAMTKRDSKGP